MSRSIDHQSEQIRTQHKLPTPHLIAPANLVDDSRRAGRSSVVELVALVLAAGLVEEGLVEE